MGHDGRFLFAWISGRIVTAVGTIGQANIVLTSSLQDVIGPYLETTLKQVEINFMRDLHPDDEVAIWCSITAAWIAYHEQYLDNKYLPDAEEKKLIAGLIAISTSVEDVDNHGVPPDIGWKLLACYDALGEG